MIEREEEQTPEQMADDTGKLADEVAEHYEEHIGEKVSEAAYQLIFGVAGVGTIFDVLIRNYVEDEHKGHISVGIGLALTQLTGAMETYIVMAEKMRNAFLKTEEGKRFKEERIEESPSPERRPPGLN